MRWSWFPWRFLVRRAAARHGFLDPLSFLARLERLAQPSEVSEPIELLRAGVAFHARGLVNTRVIQHNLDWVWPWWIERQFDPHDDAFLPRAFSVTHVNLTHRNWTAVGQPDTAELPIVDPRGLVTPHHDGWSLDGWILGGEGDVLYPSRAATAAQALDTEGDLSVITRIDVGGLALESRAWVVRDGGARRLKVDYIATSARGGRLAIGLRPYNPEGISFLHRIEPAEDRRGWRVERRGRVSFSDAADAFAGSDYQRGDVAMHMDTPPTDGHVYCEAGLATGAALFELEPGVARRVCVSVDLAAPVEVEPGGEDWPSVLSGTARLDVPEERYRRLYDQALHGLVLHSVDDVYPGPYTYRRFWFRDAALILNAMMTVGLLDRARRHLDRFPDRQTTATGYFHSQEGEWDSNGQALWAMARHAELSGVVLAPAWRRSIRRGARWIERKRTSRDGDAAHAGLLPAGFSAEHFGPNDYYYWDDLWAVGGLRAAAGGLARAGDAENSARMRGEADDLEATLARCFNEDAKRLGGPALPASPYRRMDAGAVGSLAAGFPLQLVAPDDPALRATVDHLFENCRVHGGFFQDMIHSGVNAYLTVHMAQVYLRAGSERHVELMDAVADLASPTGQWPEAIHPRTFGGCMGDGQHIWAAAEWALLMRNLFVREEGDGLVLASGLPDRWLGGARPARFGPAPTPFGAVSVEVEGARDGDIEVRWRADWRTPPAWLDIGPVAGRRERVDPAAGSVVLRAGAGE